MRDRAAARLFRVARVRRDLRQADVSDESGLSRTSIANHELGRIEGATIRALRQHAEALGLTLEITMRGPTGEIDAERRIVLIDEQKTDLPDVQDLLGTLDVKERLARQIAGERGWDADSVAVLLVITRTSRNLRTVKRFEALFSRYNLRGADAVRWLRGPHGSARLLIFVPPKAVGRATWRNGRQRVRRKPSPPRNGSNVTTSDTRLPSPSTTTPNVTTSDITQRLPP